MAKSAERRPGRVLVFCKWSGKTLADRKARLLDILGLSATDPTRYAWQPAVPGDPDHMPPGPAAPAHRRRPPAMALRAHPGPSQSQRATGLRSFGNRAGRMTTNGTKTRTEAGRMQSGMTLAELLAPPVMVNIDTASRALGLGRSSDEDLQRGRVALAKIHKIA
jgi:hypothetical protein